MCRMKSFLQILEKLVRNENRDFYNLSLGISNLTNSLFVRVVELAILGRYFSRLERWYVTDPKTIGKPSNSMVFPNLTKVIVATIFKPRDVRLLISFSRSGGQYHCKPLQSLKIIIKPSNTWSTYEKSQWSNI